MLVRDKPSSLLRIFVNYGHKSLIKLVPGRVLNVETAHNLIFSNKTVNSLLFTSFKMMPDPQILKLLNNKVITTTKYTCF